MLTLQQGVGAGLAELTSHKAVWGALGKGRETDSTETKKVKHSRGAWGWFLALSALDMKQQHRM